MNRTHSIRGAAVVCLADAKPCTPPPTEFRIFPAGGFDSTKGKFIFDPAGGFDSTKGKFIFDAESAKTVLADRETRGVKVRLDYEHASVVIEAARDPAESGKAAGWFNLELRDGALWAVDVEWTPLAARKITDREFLYLSPAFIVEKKTGRILSLDSVALTNGPATLNAAPLVELRAFFNPTGTADMSGPYITEVYDDRCIYELGNRMFEVHYRIEGSRAVLASDSLEVHRTYEPLEGGIVMKTVLKNLGLPENASEAEALAALTAHDAKASTDATPARELPALRALG